jgi:alpha-galactosidase
MRIAGDSQWVTTPDVKYEKLFVDCFADCIKYLIEEKDYDNITEITLFNEPNSLYGFPGYSKGSDEYCDLCKLMHDSFEEKGVRDDVLFTLSDDARDYTWMARALMNLQGVIDVACSHTYDFGDTYNPETGESNRDMSNNDICYNNANYNLESWRMWLADYDIPHIWGEFGTKNGVGSHETLDKYSPSRGLDIPRISLNFFNMGSVGMSYWVLFSQYYNRSEFNQGKIMDMGLWGFADEGYACRPTYYSYSMITRFIEEGDTIFPIESDDENIVAVAFRQGDKWSYAVVNNGDTDKQVAFVNYNGYPTSLNRYVYDEANVPTDNQVIPSDKTIATDGRVLSDSVKARSFVIYTNK